MTKKQELFCINYVATRDPKASALEAGYSESFSSSKAYLLPKQLSEEIADLQDKYYREQFQELATKSLKALSDVIENGENESAKVNASKFVLEIAGATEKPKTDGINIIVNLPKSEP